MANGSCTLNCLAILQLARQGNRESGLAALQQALPITVLTPIEKPEGAWSGNQESRRTVASPRTLEELAPSV